MNQWDMVRGGEAKGAREGEGMRGEGGITHHPCDSSYPPAHAPIPARICMQVNIFFSAHGVPVAYVEEAGDPYEAEMEECVGLIMDELRGRGVANDFTLAYQVGGRAGR